MVAIFFDLQKAYDTTWKCGIMRDLHDPGLRGRMPLFISNFLKFRQFAIKIGNLISNFYNQEEGVPQGSILSVTLFSIQINGKIKTLSLGIDWSLYVDDFVIYYKSKHIHTINRQLQLCLHKIQRWADDNGFKLSMSKTVCLHFCNLRTPHPEPNLTINATQILVLN